MNTVTASPSRRWIVATVIALASLVTTSVAFAAGVEHKTVAFQGAKANTGFATHAVENGKATLTWSDAFTIPDTPAPHWQVVDSKGNVYLLHRLKIKDDKLNRTIVVPSYVKDIAKVQIWCSWAEALLGEASFDKPVRNN